MPDRPYGRTLAQEAESVPAFREFNRFGRYDERGAYPAGQTGDMCQEGAKAPCCTRDEGGPFGAAL